jgi:hypothetical protein
MTDEWSTTYSGSGQFDFGVIDTPGVPQIVPWTDTDVTTLSVYGALPDSEGRQVGAVFRRDTVCTECGRGFVAGDTMEAVLAPDMAGTWHHKSCPITCPQCGRTSHHPDDVRERYCSNCHQYHSDM